MTLYMSSLPVNLRALLDWARQQRLSAADDDLGYALHAALRAAFGALGPQPFHAVGVGPSPTGARTTATPRIYGYGTADAPALREHLACFAPPEISGIFATDALATKPMPPFRTGQCLGFSARVCPIIRQDRGSRTASREVDAFVAATRHWQANQEQAATGPNDIAPTRDAVYLDWLSRQIGDAGTLSAGRLDGYRRCRISRLSANGSGTGRHVQRFDSPDARIKGLITVSNPETFQALLARGIGRHRAFGFGMLLLHPPGQTIQDD